MKRQVIWSPDAWTDVEMAMDYLAVASPNYAEKVLARLLEAGEKLGIAQTGRPGRVSGTYEKSLPDIRYMLAYYMDRDRPDGPVVILRAIHTARDWSPGGWPK